MDYKIGSLADLISGNKTLNKKKLIQKSFTPVKNKPAEKSKNNQYDDTTSKNTKTKNKKKLNHTKNDEQTTPIVNKKSLKSKGKKRKLDQTSNIDVADSNTEQPSPRKQKLGKSAHIDLADSDTEQPSPKKQKLNKNEQNAAGRIKNKINKDTKNSSEYKDKTVFVGNIPIKIKKVKIKKLFSRYGTIDSVRIRGIPVADPKTSKKVAAIKNEFHPERNTVYAFIRFKNADDAKSAEASNGEIFEDRHLRVHCCESNEKPDESKAIFVGNLPFNVEEEELWNLFKPCGLISHVRIVRDGRTAMCKGFGYVNFKDADSVQLALEMEKVMLRNRDLRISVCDSSRAKKKKTPRHRIRKPTLKSEENEGDSPKLPIIKSEQFSGSKFDDKKKKRKFSKTAIEKKKLAKKLVASKPSIQ